MRHHRPLRGDPSRIRWMGKKTANLWRVGKKIGEQLGGMGNCAEGNAVGDQGVISRQQPLAALFISIDRSIQPQLCGNPAFRISLSGRPKVSMIRDPWGCRNREQVLRLVSRRGDLLAQDLASWLPLRSRQLNGSRCRNANLCD